MLCFMFYSLKANQWDRTVYGTYICIIFVNEFMTAVNKKCIVERWKERNRECHPRGASRIPHPREAAATAAGIEHGVRGSRQSVSRGRRRSPLFALAVETPTVELDLAPEQ